MTFKQFPLAGVAAAGFALPEAVLGKAKPAHAEKLIAAATAKVDEEHGAIPIRRRTFHRVSHRHNHLTQHTIVVTTLSAH